MSRLIDADKMKESIEFYTKDLCCEDLVPNLPRIIDEVPDADAIPVEWLRKEMEKVNHAFEPHFAFMYVLQEWEGTKSIEQLQAESEMKDWEAEQEDKNGREMETL